MTQHVLACDFSCGLSTATIEYSCPSVCLRIFPSVCVSVYTITQKIMVQSSLKLGHVVVFENRSDALDIGHCPIKLGS